MLTSESQPGHRCSLTGGGITHLTPFITHITVVRHGVKHIYISFQSILQTPPLKGGHYYEYDSHFTEKEVEAQRG